MGVLLQDRDAEAVERVDVARVIVPRQAVDALAHLVCGLVRKGHAQDVAWQDPELIDKERKAMGQRPRLAGAGPRDDPHVPFCCGHRLLLLGV